MNESPPAAINGKSAPEKDGSKLAATNDVIANYDTPNDKRMKSEGVNND